jgi:hypothetical protein
MKNFWGGGQGPVAQASRLWTLTPSPNPICFIIGGASVCAISDPCRVRPAHHFNDIPGLFARAMNRLESLFH